MGGNLCSATAVSQVQLSERLAFGIIVLSLLRGCLLHIRFVRWGSIHAFDGHGGCQPHLCYSMRLLAGYVVVWDGRQSA